MEPRRRRLTLLAVATALAAPAPLAAQERATAFDVPRQPASSGIRMLASQAGIQVIVASAAVEGRQTRAVRGRMTARAALDRLLADSGLVLRSFAAGVAIIGIDRATPEPPSPPTIVVTGYRTADPDQAALTPQRSVRIEEAERLGRITLHDVLMREPAIAAGGGLASAFGQSWDAGIATVSLRSLGASRSLALVDGRRRVAGSARSTAVDVNMIPAAMVDRVEITTGAAPLHGADSIAGTINIVTKQRVEGVTLSAMNGVSERGDAASRSVSLAAGTRFDDGRGSIAIGGTYSKIDPLLFGQRYHSYVNSVANPANTGANDGIPDRLTVRDFRQVYYAYAPSFFFGGNSYLIDEGTPRIARYALPLYDGEFSYGDGGDGRNLRDRDQLRGGLDALAVLARVHYDFDGGIRYQAGIDAARSRYQGIAGIPLHRDDSRPSWFNGAGGAVARLDNPLLPSALRVFMLANGVGELAIGRTYGNFPVMREAHDRRSLTLTQSLAGPLAGRITWKAWVQHGRATDAVTTSDIPRAAQWVAARDVIADPVSGAPMCRDAAARAAGCVPLDIFGQAPPSLALKAYVLGSRNERRSTSQSLFGAETSGPLGALPGGDASLLLGFEHRRDRLATRDDPRMASEFSIGMGGYPVHPDLNVASEVSELYGRIALPLLRRRPLAHRLEAEASFRYSRHSAVGDTLGWQFAGAWSPAEGMGFRVARARSVRAPNFGELYEPAIVHELGSISDPCEAADYYQNPVRTANCRALGITTPLIDFKLGPYVTTEGNPGLSPETADSLTLGLMLQPRFLPRFKSAVDYWDISIADAIVQYSDRQVMNLCVDLPTIDNVFCRAIDRDPADGHVSAIRIRQVNAARMRTRGLDVSASYQSQVGSGTMRLGVTGSYLLQQRIETLEGVAAGNIDDAGDWRHPRFRAAMLATYALGPLSISFDTRFVSSGKLDASAQSAEAYDDNHIPPVVYNDLSVRAAVSSKMEIGAGVRNIFDTPPPYMYSTYKNGTLYDNIRRYFYVRTQMKL
jgi:outer membrane receptor protein involved in Fe transport